VYAVVAVAVEQHQVGIPVIVPVAVLVMHFQDVLCREAQPAVGTMAFLLL